MRWDFSKWHVTEEAHQFCALPWKVSSDQQHLKQYFSNIFTLHRFQCLKCVKTFGSANELAKHKQKHKQPTLRCPHCNVMKRWEHAMDDHIRTHTGEKPFQSVFIICILSFLLTSWFSPSGVATAKVTVPNRHPCSIATRNPATHRSGLMQKPRNRPRERREIKTRDNCASAIWSHDNLMRLIFHQDQYNAE